MSTALEISAVDATGFIVTDRRSEQSNLVLFINLGARYRVCLPSKNEKLYIITYTHVYIFPWNLLWKTLQQDNVEDQR